MKKKISFLPENFHFLEMTFSIYLNRRVFVMKKIIFAFYIKCQDLISLKNKKTRIFFLQILLCVLGLKTAARYVLVYLMGQRRPWSNYANGLSYLLKDVPKTIGHFNLPSQRNQFN